MKKSVLFFFLFIGLSMAFLTGYKKHKHSQKTPKNSTEMIEPQKTLDLSIPFSPEQFKSKEPIQLQSNFTIEKQKKKESPVMIDTHSIMSIEPENEKTKSFDGAGININLKP